jgi:putative hydrolase of the HAD superfamily
MRVLYTTLFFDLDETLYSSSCGLWPVIQQRMTHYMDERLGLPRESIPYLRRNYFETYGTTLRGLQIHHQVDTEDYLAYVHDLPLREYLQPVAGVREILLSLPQARWIFTNADSDHAKRVLQVLDLEGCFQGIIDIRRLEFTCKPEAAAYQKALAIAGEARSERCVLFDDSPVNLEGAKKYGWMPVLVGSDHRLPAYTGCQVASILELPHSLPELWQCG